MENLDDLMRDFYAAQDSAEILAAYNAIADWREGEGVYDPGFALCAALLLRPESIPEARAILPDAGKMENAQDMALYRAILETPYDGDRLSWWFDVDGKIGASMVYIALTCEYSNAFKFALYARLVVVRGAAIEGVCIADDIARAGGDVEKLRAASGRLDAVRAAIERAQGAGNQTAATAPKWGGAWSVR
jgi:hypothetical protein